MTYSIVARDPDTGQLGVAVQSHAPAVGSLCPFAQAGVGAVATQSIVDPAYGPLGLARMASGEEPFDALAELTSLDTNQALRQVALLDARGRVAVHTGSRCIAEAGHVTGDGFSCQANMMRGTGVPEAMAAAFSTSSGALADRLLVALDTAEAAGGDIRGRQSAAMVVVAAVADGPLHGLVLDVRVDDHADPLGELHRLVRLQSDDPATIEAVGRGNPEGWFWKAVSLANQGDVEAAREILDRVYAVDDAWRELLRRLPKSGLLHDVALVERLT